VFIEYIYPDEKTKGYIKTFKPLSETTVRERIFLKTVPKEYLNIEGLEWFAVY
jgi:hypothetical protein